MTPRILLTGFRPFLHHSVNASERVLTVLASERADIETLLLPVSFQNSFLELQAFLSARPAYDFVVMMGQANGRAAVSLERVALNWMESKNPDNDGDRPVGGRILNGAPDSYIVDFFPTKWKDELSVAGCKVEVSLSAGAFVCNNLYYKMAHALRDSATRALFVHLPLLPEQLAENPGAPTMKLETQTRIVSTLLDLLAGM